MGVHIDMSRRLPRDGVASPGGRSVGVPGRVVQEDERRCTTGARDEGDRHGRGRQQARDVRQEGRTGGPGDPQGAGRPRAHRTAQRAPGRAARRAVPLRLPADRPVPADPRRSSTDFQKDVYFVALLAAAVATGLLIAPAAQHRVLFRQKDKEQLLRRSNRSAVAGLVVLGLAICAAILLVVDVLFSRTPAWIAAGVVAVLLGWWWVAVPYWRRAHTEQDDPDDDDADV